MSSSGKFWLSYIVILVLSTFLFYSSCSRANQIAVLDLAKVMHCEAGQEGRLGMLAVANTIKNRVSHSCYPSDLVKVINQPKQYSCMEAGYHPSLKDAIHQRIVELAWDVVDNSTPSVTKATHYHTTTSSPYWSTHKSMEYLGTIGNHKFYYEHRSCKS